VVYVEVRSNEDIDFALKRFKNKCIKEKIFVDLRKKRFYEKPSEVKRKERMKSARKLARKMRKRRRR